MVVSDTGRIRLGQALNPLGTLDAAHVWDLARTASGDLYAATGDAGKVYRREGKDDAAWSLVYDAKDTQALALAVLADGHVVVGTGPSGQVIDLTDPEHPAASPDRAVQYIWDLAVDTTGGLYAATGPSGQLWKRSAGGKWSLLLDTRHSHLLCVAVGPDGAVYAGSDGEGLIYRVAPDGKATVVYDAPQNEIRTLRFGPDRALYAGTAAEAGGSGGSGRGGLVFSSGDRAEPLATAPSNGPGGTRSLDVQKKAEATPSRSGQTRDSFGRLGAAACGLGRRQLGLSDRPRRRPARGLPGQGAHLRARLAGRPPARGDGGGRANLRGAQPRSGVGSDQPSR